MGADAPLRVAATFEEMQSDNPRRAYYASKGKTPLYKITYNYDDTAGTSDLPQTHLMAKQHYKKLQVCDIRSAGKLSTHEVFGCCGRWQLQTKRPLRTEIKASLMGLSGLQETT